MVRIALVGAGLACAGMAIVFGARGLALTRPGLLFLVIGPSAAAIVLTYVAIGQAWRIARWQPARIARRVAGELAFLGLALLVVEALVAIWAPDRPSGQLVRRDAAAKLGLPFDTRTYSEVVAQLRESGVDALPGLARDWPRHPFVRERLPDGLYPLSHASHVSVVECNEGGEYHVYQTDEFGFNNPPGLLTNSSIGIAAVGESLTFGHCVPSAQSLIGILRQVYPRTANFGMAGSLNLTMLATFREYVEPLKPPLVLWILNPWDVGNEDELQDPVLRRYLDPAFSQHLRERQSEVDRLVRRIAIPAQVEADRTARQAIDRAEAGRVTGVPLLAQLRARRYISLWRSRPETTDRRLFDQVLTLAKQTTQRWGGDFVVLILPTPAAPSALPYEHFKRVLTERGIPVIDAMPLFQGRPDPAAFYTLRIGSHPTAAGHALLADYVSRELEQRFPQRLATLR
jgi:hypothetical protein